MSKGSIDSSSSSQRKHLFARVTPLLLSWLRVSTLSHVKKPILGGNNRITYGTGRESEGGENVPAFYT